MPLYHTQRTPRLRLTGSERCRGADRPRTGIVPRRIGIRSDNTSADLHDRHPGPGPGADLPKPLVVQPFPYRWRSVGRANGSAVTTSGRSLVECRFGPGKRGRRVAHARSDRHSAKLAVLPQARTRSRVYLTPNDAGKARPPTIATRRTAQKVRGDGRAGGWRRHHAECRSDPRIARRLPVVTSYRNCVRKRTVILLPVRSRLMSRQDKPQTEPS